MGKVKAPSEKGATFINPYQGLKQLRRHRTSGGGFGATFINPYQGLKPQTGMTAQGNASGATFINPYQGLKHLYCLSTPQVMVRVQLLLIPIRD